MSRLAAGIVSRELARADGSLNTFFGVHSGLAMGTIALLGSEEQKARWLPPMARLELIGAFALTEPEHGSDSVSLETEARRDGDGYILNGAKRWIGNASFADLVIVWARDDEGDVGAYVVEKGTPGFDAVHRDQGQDRQAGGVAGRDRPERRPCPGGEPARECATRSRTRRASWTRRGAAPPGSAWATRWRASRRPWPTPRSARSSGSRSPASSSSRPSWRRWSPRPRPCSSSAFGSPSCRSATR